MHLTFEKEELFQNNWSEFILPNVGLVWARLVHGLGILHGALSTIARRLDSIAK